MITDFQSTFEEYYDPEDHDTTEDVMGYGFYYMGVSRSQFIGEEEVVQSAEIKEYLGNTDYAELFPIL